MTEMQIKHRTTWREDVVISGTTIKKGKPSEKKVSLRKEVRTHELLNT
jgi:hypothetical protein